MFKSYFNLTEEEEKKIKTKFSPIRAVMFWPNSGDKLWSSRLLMLGMKIYIYDPLNLSIPNDKGRYSRDAQTVFDYVTFRSPLNLEELIKFIRSPAADHSIGPYVRDFPYHWKIASRFYNVVVERLAAKKSVEMTHGVFNAQNFESIAAREPVDISELKYSNESIKILHSISHDSMHDNPLVLFRKLCEYMKCQEGKNLYVNTFIYNVARSCKFSPTVQLVFKTGVLHKGSVCFGPNNRDLRKMIILFTVLFCPWCHKPINVAIKKKSSTGGAHKSQIFTDEYTQEPLYCVEKNKRGILSYPLLYYDLSSKTLFSNSIEWEINKSFIRIFTVTPGENGRGAKLVIYTKQQTKSDCYVPVVTEVTCTENFEECLMCKD